MSYMAVLALVSLPDSLPDEVSERSRYTWNEDGAARGSDRLVDHTSGGRTTRKRVTPCCWALARRGDIFDPDVPNQVGTERPSTPNSAARWPLLRSLAAALNKYEDAPHGVA